MVAQTEEGDLTTFIPDGEWEPQAMSMESQSVKLICCPQNFSILQMTFVIKRRPLFICFNFVMPCVLLLVVAISAFLVTPESGDKTSMTMTLLLAMMVFLAVTADQLPHTSDVIPLMCKHI